MNKPEMSCDQNQLRLLLGNELSPDLEAVAARHVANCEECRRNLESFAGNGEWWSAVKTCFAENSTEMKMSHSSTRSSLGKGMQKNDVLESFEGDDESFVADFAVEFLKPCEQPGTLGKIDEIEILKVIGRGGMGIVLKGFQRDLNRFVAVKVMSPRLSISASARARFAREARAAAAIVHPNVMAIHSINESSLLPYLVMPYVECESLQERIDRQGPLNAKEVLRISCQVSAGLAAAHSQGLVHRDVKPANILLERGVDRMLLTDFGLARAVDDASLTRTGVIAGTPQYMSPEQARGDSVDQRSDLFSLGSVMYAMCTGRPPFRSETAFGVMSRIIDDQSTAIYNINPDIPDWLCTIVNKLMSKQANDRFDSATEVLGVLESSLAHLQQPSYVPLPKSVVKLKKFRQDATQSSTSIDSRSSTRRFKRIGYSVFALCAALLIFMFIVLAMNSVKSPQIAGKWHGDDWGDVVLEQKEPGEYSGTYTDTFGEAPGELHLEWDPVERRFNGTWKEGKDRGGEISIRLVEEEIRGAWTTDQDAKIEPGSPHLADLLWQRKGDPNRALVRVTPELDDRHDAMDREFLITQAAILRSMKLLDDAIRSEKLDELALLKDKSDPKVWLSENLIVKPVNDKCIEIALNCSPETRADAEKIVASIRDSYRRFIDVVRRPSNAEILKELMNARKKVQLEIFALESELDSFSADTEEDRKKAVSAKTTIQRSKRLLNALDEKIQKLPEDTASEHPVETNSSHDEHSNFQPKLQVFIASEVADTDNREGVIQWNILNGEKVRIRVNNNALLDESDIASAVVARDQPKGTGYSVEILLTENATERFASDTRWLSSQIPNARLAIYVYSELRSVPKLLSEIPAGKIRFSGNFTEEEAEKMAAVFTHPSTREESDASPGKE